MVEVATRLYLATFMSATRPPEFLSTVLSHSGDGQETSRIPRVTLSFAQSLDAKIAGKDGKQLILSGKESMIMTHWWVLLYCTPSSYNLENQDENDA
jgi:hypothetical protein